MARTAPLALLVLLGCASTPPAAHSSTPPIDADESRPDVTAPEPRDSTIAPDLVDRSPDVATVAADVASPDSAAPDVVAAGCGAAEGLPEGQATIAVAGANRTYILRLPTGYTSTRAWPLILALHPNGGSGIGFWDVASGARSIRALVKEKAILVLPLARPAGGGWDWRGDLPADLAFFDALMARLKDKLCVDNQRIFAMGFSGGGSFSGVLACRRHDIRAFASGSGVEYYAPKDCTGPVAAWITAGADELIAARTAFRDDWVMRDGCQPTMTPTMPATCQAYACPKGSPVHFCVHPGGHLWPDYGSAAAWSFFSQF